MSLHVETWHTCAGGNCYLIVPNAGLKLQPRNADIHPMDPSAIALQGLQQANIQLEAAAVRIASASGDSTDSGPVDVVSLSAEMVALMSARTQFDANVATLKAVDQMQRNLVDVHV